MKRSILATAFLLTTALYTRVVSETTLTLEELFEKSNGCSDDIAIAQLEDAIGREDIKFYRSEALPMVSLEAGVGLGSQSLKSDPFSTTAQYGITRANAQSANWNLSVYQPIFTFGSAFNALKLAHRRDDMLDDMLRLKKDAYYLQLIASFNNALLAQKAVESAEKAAEYAGKTFARVERAFEMDGVARRDLLRVKALARREEANLLQARATKTIAFERLSDISEITVADSVRLIQDNNGWATRVPSGDSPTASLEYRLKEHEVALQELNINYRRAKLFPSIGLFASAGSQVQRIASLYDGNDFRTVDEFNNMVGQNKQMQLEMNPTVPVLNGSDTIGQVMRRDLNNETDQDFSNNGLGEVMNPEFFNYTLGLQLTWNIFDGRRTRAERNKAKYSFEKAQREAKQIREENARRIEETRTGITTVNSNIDAVSLQLEAARGALEEAERDYADGFIDVTELLEIERELREAEQMHMQLEAQRVLAVAQLKALLGIPLYEEKK